MLLFMALVIAALLLTQMDSHERGWLAYLLVLPALTVLVVALYPLDLLYHRIRR